MFRNHLEVKRRQYKRYPLANLHKWLNILDHIFFLELLSKVNPYNYSTWESYSKHEHVYIEFFQRFSVQKTCTGRNQNNERSNENPLSTVDIRQKSNWSNGGCKKDSNEKAGTQEANSLLAFTKHMCLCYPVINIL